MHCHLYDQKISRIVDLSCWIPMEGPCSARANSCFRFTSLLNRAAETAKLEKDRNRYLERARTGERGQVELMNFHNKKKACRMVTPSYVRWFITPSEYDYKIL